MNEPEIGASARAAAPSTPDMAAGSSGSRVSPAVRLSRTQAYLQLIRFPSTFTAVADVLAGYLIVADLFDGLYLVDGLHLGGLLLAGSAVHAGGCALNDYMDRFIDVRERPRRPIPSGNIDSAAAWRLSIGLFALGFSAALAVGTSAAIVTAVLIGLVLSYNCAAKSHDVLGPLNMGVCRAAYLLLGMSTGVIPLLIAFFCTSLTLLYVSVVGGLRREEVGNPPIGTLVKWLTLGVVLLDAGYVAVARGLPWALPVAACLLPALYFGRRFPVA